MKQIIDSMLQTDLYKLTMQQAVFHQYFNAHGRYQFVCRNKGVKFTDAMVSEIRFQLERMKTLSLKEEEKAFLRGMKFFKEDYLDWLEDFRFKPRELFVSNEDGELEIEAEGRWVSAILWEVPLLSIVNEVYFKHTTDFVKLRQTGLERLNAKIEMIQEVNDEVGNNFIVAEFGTRRRYSKEWQEEVTRELAKAGAIVGTSNVRLAKILGIKPIGTMAHEFLCGHLGLVDNIAEAQKRALHVWLQEYDAHNLGIALSDSFTSDAFFRDFGVALSNEFDGVRHDSGSAIIFGEKTIDHYQKMGIDPKTKTIVFSDGLTVPDAIDIYNHFKDRVQTSFGIGTAITNDLGPTPLNIVMKLVGMRRTKDAPEVPIIKLSDVPSKAIGNQNMIQSIKSVYDIVA